MSTEHRIKTWAPYYDAVARGDKTFEVRRDDRGYQKGDILILQKADPEPPHYYIQYEWIGATRRPAEIRKRITYVLTGGQFGIEPGYVVLGLGDCE